VLAALVDGLAHGIGFALVLITLGAAREIIGQGSLLSGAPLLFGPGSENWTLQFSERPVGFLLAILPPGAFIGLALFIALRNYIARRSDE